MFFLNRCVLFLLWFVLLLGLMIICTWNIFHVIGSNSTLETDILANATQKIPYANSSAEEFPMNKWDGPVVNCTNRYCHKEMVVNPTQNCLVYRCSICYCYNSSCPFDYLPPSPMCPTVVCTDIPPTPTPTPPTPPPSPSPPSPMPSKNIWKLVVSSISLAILSGVAVFSAYFLYQSHAERQRRRRNRYMRVFRIDQFRQAREEADRLERDMQDIRDRFGISNENFNAPDHVETIEECVAREDAEDDRRAEERERQAAEDAAAATPRTFRERVRNEARMRRDQLHQNFNRSRIREEAIQRQQQLAQGLTSVRASLPQFNSRIRAMIHRD